MEMEGSTMPGLSRPSSDDSSPSICYDIVFHMPIGAVGGEAVHSRWYKITVHAGGSQEVDGEKLQMISPFWKGNHHQDYSFATLGSDLYCVGGHRCYRSVAEYDSDSPLPFVRSVYKLDITHPDNNWVPVPKMICPRLQPHNFVIGNKLFVWDGHYCCFPPVRLEDNAFDDEVFNDPIINYSSSDDELFDGFVMDYTFPTAIPDAEVFDPILNEWEVLPDPPGRMPYDGFIIAALENPDRILVASSCFPADSDHRWADFYTYDVGDGCWRELERHQRKLHRHCPLGWCGKPLTVANTLYWLRHNARLLAYDLELDVWFLGNLSVLGNSFFNEDDPSFIPSFVHLDNHRFCFLQRASDSCLHCSIVDVSRKLKERRLDITVVCLLEYKMDHATRISDCLLLGKQSRNEVQIREEAKQE
ncbi:uncharacterized protein LOC132184828 [Corylus avellana]|uniref:uncharacterized protein LOC132184828 n=1 Tax=Corylus avellana TaxID=13451 RepID=UPI00286C80D8|nr:uncharacterized protein LOC132184828 [Corylus avellana]